MTNTTDEFGPATLNDLFLAPTFFAAFIITGLLTFSIYTQPHWWRSKFSTNCKLHDKDQSVNQKSFLSADDSQSLYNFKRYQNSPWPLFKLALPCILSVAFCPATIYCGPTVSEFFYPEKYGGMPVINDVIQAFLMPAGLVYAIAFGFALQNALQSQDGTNSNLGTLETLLRQCTAIIERLEISKEDKKHMIECLKDCVISWMRVVVTGKVDIFNNAHLWKITDMLRKDGISSPNYKDERFINELFSKVFDLEAMVSKCNRASQPRINVVQWIFLELLGFISFFGILMVKAGSYRLELTICMLTVFTISAFAYVLADIDSAYHGFFRVDLTVFVCYMEQLKNHYECGARRHSAASQCDTCMNIPYPYIQRQVNVIHA